jgi:DNA-binding transcriptional MerR regulator
MTSPDRDDLTVDRLAARAGMTVRNVRAYAARGLLQPPRIVGRTGYYGPQHVERLTLVREMLAEGYTLSAIEKSLTSAGHGATASLALRRALVAPWQPDEPYEASLAELAARSGLPSDPALVEALTALGVLEVVQGDRVRVLNPALLAIGREVVGLGVDAHVLLRSQLAVTALVEQAAATYVEMFRTTVWQAFVDEGMPADGWPRIQAVVEKLQPVAAQALLASFRTAMAEAVQAEVEVLLPPVELSG